MGNDIIFAVYLGLGPKVRPPGTENRQLKTDNRHMTRFLLAAMGVIALMCSQSVDAQVARGEKMFGVNGGYATHNKSAVAGLSFRYAVSPWVRLVPQVGCVFRHYDEDAFYVDLNAQFPFSFGTHNVDLYPLAGFAYNSWSKHYDDPDGDDVSTRMNRIGANLGAGFDFRCTPTLNLGIEAKYTLVKHFTSLYITASISYVF